MASDWFRHYRTPTIHCICIVEISLYLPFHMRNPEVVRWLAYTRLVVNHAYMLTWPVPNIGQRLTQLGCWSFFYVCCIRLMGKGLPLFSVLDTRRDIRALRGRLISTSARCLALVL